MVVRYTALSTGNTPARTTDVVARVSVSRLNRQISIGLWSDFLRSPHFTESDAQVDRRPVVITGQSTTSADDGRAGVMASNGRPAAASVAAASPRSAGSASKLDPAAFDRLLSHVPDKFFAAKDFNPFAHYDDDPQSLQDYAEVLDLHSAHRRRPPQEFHGRDAVLHARPRDVRPVAAVSDSPARVSDRGALSLLGSSVTSDRVRELWFAREKFSFCLTLLRKIEFVRSAAASLRELKANRLYLHAVLLLNRALTLINHDDLREVDGLIELREALLGTSTERSRQSSPRCTRSSTRLRRCLLRADSGSRTRSVSRTARCSDRSRV